MIRLTEERTTRGWSMSELSYKARVPVSHISRIEAGKMEPFKPEVNRLVEVFDIPADKLFEEVEENTNK